MPRKRVDTVKKGTNTHIEVMSSVSSIIDFMKQQVVSNLIEANAKGSITLEEETLRKVCFYVETSMTNAFTRSSDQLENTIKKIK